MSALITFEGGEGAGKSSQVRRLASRVESSGVDVLRFHEPGGTPFGDAIYALLRDPTSRTLRRLYRHWIGIETGASVDPLAELFLFEAARAQLVAREIRPALTRGVVVLGDRFTDSTPAYQGHGRFLPLDMVHQANDMATGGLRPSLTILLDVPPELGLSRTRGADHRMEQEGTEFHERVRRGY
ncbi:MAG: dTMP kinase [Chloroflexi bacterium]|nr:dTMP kinase [Chloroflexota bacterium]